MLLNYSTMYLCWLVHFVDLTFEGQEFWITIANGGKFVCVYLFFHEWNAERVAEYNNSFISIFYNGVVNVSQKRIIISQKNMITFSPFVFALDARIFSVLYRLWDVHMESF